MPAVQQGNMIAARVALLCMVAVVRGVFWCELWLMIIAVQFCLNFKFVWHPNHLWEMNHINIQPHEIYVGSTAG